MQIARDCRIPFVQFVESAGGDLRPRGNRSSVALNVGHFAESGRTFYEVTELSKMRIPTISIVFGSSTAGGAYQPGMSDYNIFVKDQAEVALAGPPLVQMATGEISSREDIGGAKMHAEKSGLAEYLAEDDLDGIRIAREVMSHLNWEKEGTNPRFSVEKPLYDQDDLLGLIEPSLKTPFDIREIIGRISDGSKFEEFKPLFGPTIICGFISIHGYPVGIVANNGILFSESSLKGAHFVELCGHRGIPLVFLQNITGFMVGREYEAGGIAKDGAKLVTAVSCVPVPKFTVIIGGSHGAGNYGMCGRAYDPRFLFMWPNARISVMGGEQAASVLSAVGNEDPEEIRAKYERESSPYYSSARLWDDGVIDPRDTRDVLGLSISASLNAPMPETGFGVFRM